MAFEPWRPLPEAVKIAFEQACEEYNYDFPTGTTVAQLAGPVQDLFFERGRIAAFEVLSPVLPQDRAIKVAEAISAAAWHVRAPELAQGDNKPRS